jgi:cytochrome P450
MEEAALLTPPAPPPRVVPDGARPSLAGYLRYFRIMAQNPLEIFTERNFAEPVTTAQVFGQRYVLVHDPDAIHRFLVANAANYGLTRLRRALFRPLIGEGLLIAEDDLWRRTRRALSPVFNHRRVREFAPIMRAVVEARAAALEARDGEVVSISQDMLALALDVLIACLFSGDTAIDARRFSASLDRLLDISGTPHPLDLAGAPDWLPRLGRGEARRLVADIRAQVGAALAARRAGEGATPAADDFLGLLMKAGVEEGAPLGDDEIIDNLVTFLAAGHETTARTLAWTFYLLAKAPAVRARAVQEVAAAGLDRRDPADWAEATPFVTAIIKESMRLYPAAALLSRRALAPDRLGGVEVPAGAEVVTSSWVLHRHRRLWTRPDAFDPDRFLGARGQGVPRYAYLPFGAGPRVCIGASFSMQEMAIVLGVFLSRLALEDAGSTPPQPVMRITIHPSTPVDMRVWRRRGVTVARNGL